MSPDEQKEYDELKKKLGAARLISLTSFAQPANDVEKRFVELHKKAK